MINTDRLNALLLDLLRISSPSRKEHAVAERLRREMEALGAEVAVDDAGARVGGTTGNVIARVRGRAESAPPLLLSAHMDTVVPCENIRPVVEGTVANLGTGMREIHTVKEWLDLRDVHAAAELVAEVVRLNAEAP